MTAPTGKPRKLHKPQKNSPESLIENLLAASEPPPKCPRHVKLRKIDRPFWNGVVGARARRDWTSTELVIAQQLARCQADIEATSHRLDREGVTSTNLKGTVVMNPIVTVLEGLARREMALMRILRMGAQPGEGPAMVMQRQSERAAEELREEIKNDDHLLAM